MERYARKCDVTGKGMNEGFVFGDGNMYFSEEQYLIDYLRREVLGDDSKELSDEFILKESYDNEEYYYTEWEEIDDDCYYDAEGNEYEL
jgi:hypothetical protein